MPGQALLPSIAGQHKMDLMGEKKTLDSGLASPELSAWRTWLSTHTFEAPCKQSGFSIAILSDSVERLQSFVVIQKSVRTLAP